MKGDQKILNTDVWNNQSVVTITEYKISELKYLLKELAMFIRNSLRPDHLAGFDLEEIDKLRRAEFKEHEIEQEYERRVKLKNMDEVHRKQAEVEFQKQQAEHQKHQKINHPGSKDQLEEVWEEQDHLEGNEFNPHTFFDLHDTDGNKHWDPSELEALFQIEASYFR